VLAERVQGGKAVVGKFDGETYSLAAATHAGKVFVHSPHNQQQQASQLGLQITYLNINKQITALAAGGHGQGDFPSSRGLGCSAQPC
jgi:hypothetical protein